MLSKHPRQLAIAVFLITQSALAHGAAAAERIVALGGTVTEIVFALGAGASVVGVDSSSVHPAEVAGLPIVGYQRRLAAEGVLSLAPTRVLATDESGPPAAITQIRDAGVEVAVFKAAESADGAMRLIRDIAAALGRAARGEELVAQLTADLRGAGEAVAADGPRPRVLFIYARGPGTLSVAGRHTGADEMIRLAGATNAAADFDGFKPLSAEGVVAAAPEVVLMLSRGVDSLGGRDAALDLPGVMRTPAGASRRLVVMDDLYLLGFGPRMGRAVRELAVAVRAPAPGN